MPHPNPSSDQLSVPDLKLLRQRLSGMNLNELERYYHASHNACRYVTRLPTARLIQELVAAWKELRRKLP